MNSSEKQHGDKIYRGGYTYYKNNNPYSEENFEVYKNKVDYSLYFKTEVHSRLNTGEMLSLYVDYSVTKDYNPTALNIVRRLGKDVAKETFLHDPKENNIQYTFYKRDPDSAETGADNLVTQESLEIPTPPRFHISNPASCTGMLFIRSKKSSSSEKSFFSTLVSNNQWEFTEAPEFKSIATERVGISTEKINVEGHTLHSLQYKVYEDDPERSNRLASHNAFKVWMSQYAGIPYIIRTLDGIKVQITYLNVFEGDLDL